MLALSDATVALREWRSSDAPALAAVFELSEPDARRFIAKAHRHRCAGTAVALAITRPGEDVPVGNVDLARFSDDGMSAVLACRVVPGARDEGLATAAADLVRRWGIAELGLEEIEVLGAPDGR